MSSFSKTFRAGTCVEEVVPKIGLGESYVAFRDTKERLGILDELYPHRKAMKLGNFTSVLGIPSQDLTT